MKKILSVLLIINTLICPAFSYEMDLEDYFTPEELSSPDAVDVDFSTPSVKTKKNKQIKSESYNYAVNDEKTLSPQNYYKYQNDNPYASKSTSFTREKKHGNFTLGTKYDSTFSPDNLDQTSTLFTKYNKQKFSFSTAYKNGTFTPLSQQGKGTLYFSPEYKLNNHVSIQNIYSTSFLDKNSKNEFVFSLTPFKDDRMNFNVGASQIYSENSAPTRSQLNFSTKIRF